MVETRKSFLSFFQGFFFIFAKERKKLKGSGLVTNILLVLFFTIFIIMVYMMVGPQFLGPAPTLASNFALLPFS